MSGDARGDHRRAQRGRTVTPAAAPPPAGVRYYADPAIKGRVRQSCGATNDHGWGDRWTRLVPRAECDVRVLGGTLVRGVGEAIDFNGVSHQEKGACPGTGCAFDLRNERARLLERLRA